MLMNIDFDTLTLADIEDFEDASGMSFDELTKGRLRAKAITALVWIVKRRDDSTLTLEQVRQMPVAVLNEAAQATVTADDEPVEEGKRARRKAA